MGDDRYAWATMSKPWKGWSWSGVPAVMVRAVPGLSSWNVMRPLPVVVGAGPSKYPRVAMPKVVEWDGRCVALVGGDGMWRRNCDARMPSRLNAWWRRSQRRTVDGCFMWSLREIPSSARPRSSGKEADGVVMARRVMR